MKVKEGKEKPGSRRLLMWVARVWPPWTVSKQTHNKARSTRSRDKSTGPVRFRHVIEQRADVSVAADSLSVGSVVRWVRSIFQQPLKCEERSFWRWEISPDGGGLSSLSSVCSFWRTEMVTTGGGTWNCEL